MVDNVDVVSSFVTSAGWSQQQTATELFNTFGALKDLDGNDSDSTRLDSLQNKIQDEFSKSKYGEVDASTQLQFNCDNVAVTIATVNLCHNSFSRRDFTYIPTDPYKGMGRVKHEHHIIHQGMYQTIYIRSFQKQPKHDRPSRASEDFAEGGDCHFEIVVYRNVELFEKKNPNKYKDESVMKQFGKELFVGNKFSNSKKLPVEEAKTRVITEFVDCVNGNFDKNKLKSSLESHANSVGLMSAIYKSHVSRVKKQNPIINMPYNAKPKLENTIVVAKNDANAMRDEERIRNGNDMANFYSNEREKRIADHMANGNLY